MGNFGYKHLTGLAWLGALIAILLTALLLIRKKVSKKGGDVNAYDRAVIRYTAYFMWAWEIIKTIRLVNGADFGAVGSYPFFMAPFHLCSMALYAYLIVGSKRAGKLAEWLKPFSFAVMLLATTLILAMPDGAGIMGNVNNWSFVYDNILPYQSFLYHGCLIFVPLYMVLSGFYIPKWVDILKAVSVLIITACFAQAINFIFEGSNADFMMLRYGNGSPFVGLLHQTPALYYLVMGGASIAGTSVIISITILINYIVSKIKNKKVVSKQQ